MAILPLCRADLEQQDHALPLPRLSLMCLGLNSASWGNFMPTGSVVERVLLGVAHLLIAKPLCWNQPTFAAFILVDL